MKRVVALLLMSHPCELMAIKGMIDYLLRKNYWGPFGILGHIKNEDVQVTLTRNLNGLQSLMLESPKTSVNSNKQV